MILDFILSPMLLQFFNSIPIGIMQRREGRRCMGFLTRGPCYYIVCRLTFMIGAVSGVTTVTGMLRRWPW